MTNNNTEASLRSIEETKRLIRPILTANGDSSKYQHLIETKQLARPNFKLIQELVKSVSSTWLNLPLDSGIFQFS